MHRKSPPVGLPGRLGPAPQRSSLAGHISKETALLARLYAEQSEALRRSLPRRLPRRASSTCCDREDLIQETFLNLLRKRDLLGVEDVREWPRYLHAIAINLLRDSVRRGRRELRAMATLVGQPGYAPTSRQSSSFAADAESTPVDVLAAGAVREALRNAPPELIAVYRHRYELQLSERQAAQALAISYQTLRSRQTRLLGLIRATLASGRDELRDKGPRRKKKLTQK